MTQPHENLEPASVADLHDRIVDRALSETIGGETPPDLAASILAGEPKCTIAADGRRPRAWSAALLAVAATLLVAVSVYLTQQEAFKTAKLQPQLASSKTDRLSPPSEPGQQVIGLDGLVNDASGPRQKGEVRDRNKELLEDGMAKQEPTVRQESDRVVHVPRTSAETPVSFGHQWRAQSAKDKLQSSAVEQFGSNNKSLRPLGGREPFRLGAFAIPGDHELDPRTRDLEMLVTPRIIVQDEEGRQPLMRSSDGSTVLGTGPGTSGDQYTRIYENPFVKAVGGDAVSTFSIDVDTASYANVRQFLMNMRRLPPPDAVRIEELINYFRYDYAGPKADDEAPFAAHVEVAGCPWAPEHRLVRIGIKGREIERDHRPPSNLVFLVDVSGSMNEPNKLPLVIDGLRQLTRELGENDRVAIVVYASSEGLALKSTRGDQQQTILAALDRLRAGGSTAGGAGIQLAYQIAEDHFIPGGTNRVILCTDGDFNVGVTSTAELERLVAKKAKDTKVFLSVLGFGRGNLNDAMMQTIADRGNGNHHYVDNLREARKVLVEEMTGTLITIAKDVKIQVEFNPAQVAGYRLIGYENRMLRTEDFNDDTKDAGEIGAGHTVTALYEVIPAGKPVDVPEVDELKYQPDEKAAAGSDDAALAPSSAAASKELLTLKMRYKQPEGDVSQKLEWPVTDGGQAFDAASGDFRFAAAVAEFGLLLRSSQYRGNASFDAIVEIGMRSLDQDAQGYRTEFIGLVRRAKEIASH